MQGLASLDIHKTSANQDPVKPSSDPPEATAVKLEGDMKTKNSQSAESMQPQVSHPIGVLSDLYP